MSLDIIRFIEIKDKKKKNWTRVCLKKLDNCFNNGKSIAEYWFEKQHPSFKNGLPENVDQKNIDVYESWGYSPKYITLDELENLISSYEHELHNTLKVSKIFNDLSEEGILQTSDLYEGEYPYNDYEIKNQFDDDFAMGMLKLNAIRDDYAAARAIVDFIYNNCYIPNGNIRIIYLYNR